MVMDEWQVGLMLAQTPPKSEPAGSAWQIALMLIDRSRARPAVQGGRTVVLLSDGD